MTLSTCLLLALAAREPLPIPGWTPPARAEATSPTPAEATPLSPSSTQPSPPPEPPAVEAPSTVEASRPAVRKEDDAVPPSIESRRVGLTLGVGALVLSPSLELEVAPWDHVSLYLGGELSATRLGFGAQAGVRLRPMRGLLGPFLDLHVRVAQYAGFLHLLPSVVERGSPGVMLGFSLSSKSGFLFSAGMGLSLLAEVTETRYVVSSRSTGFLPIPSIDAFSTTKVAPVPELRLNVGWAL